jgi:phage shock protein E
MKKNLLYILSIFSLLLLLGGCSKVSDEDLLAAHDAYNNGALIIDVRTKEEFKSGHVKHAVNLPLQNLEQYYKYIPKDKEIIVYCQTGNRSGVAAEYLRKRGRTVYDVATQEDWERELPR